MNVRDRQMATAVIWLILFAALAVIVPRLLAVQIDYAPLWEGPPPMFGGGVVDANLIETAVMTAQERLPSVLAEAQTSIRAAMAVRVPLAAAISLVLIAATALATWFVWRQAGLEARLAADLIAFEKAKRRSRVETFVDDLDAEELDILRQRIEDDRGTGSAAHSTTT